MFNLTTKFDIGEEVIVKGNVAGISVDEKGVVTYKLKLKLGEEKTFTPSNNFSDSCVYKETECRYGGSENEEHL